LNDRRVKVLSVGTTILGNAVYHHNLCAALAPSRKVTVVGRSVADYWDFRAKVLFAVMATHRFGRSTYRLRAEWANSLIARRGIFRDIGLVKPDVLHCHTQAHALGCHSLNRQVPLVVTMDATSRLLQRLPAYPHQRWALERVSRLETRLFENCAVVGGVSRWVTESLQNDYGQESGRIRLCLPCVDTDRFSPVTSEHSTSRGKIHVVFVGNDLVRKGGLLLLALAAGEFAESCEFHMISGAEPPSHLPANVSWHQSFKPGSEALIECLRSADVFALPTNEDCFPQALIEALACGLPLIGTTVMGVPELVQDGVNGFCVPPGDRMALAEAVRKLVASVELRRKFGLASRQMASDRFSFSASRENWESVFLQAAASKGR